MKGSHGLIEQGGHLFIRNTQQTGDTTRFRADYPLARLVNELQGTELGKEREYFS